LYHATKPNSTVAPAFFYIFVHGFSLWQYTPKLSHNNKYLVERWCIGNANSPPKKNAKCLIVMKMSLAYFGLTTISFFSNSKPVLLLTFLRHNKLLPIAYGFKMKSPFLFFATAMALLM